MKQIISSRKGMVHGYVCTFYFYNSSKRWEASDKSCLDTSSLCVNLCFTSSQFPNLHLTLARVASPFSAIVRKLVGIEFVGDSFVGKDGSSAG